MKLDDLERAIRIAVQQAPQSPLTVLCDGSACLSAEHLRAAQTLNRNGLGDLQGDPTDPRKPWL